MSEKDSEKPAEKKPAEHWFRVYATAEWGIHCAQRQHGWPVGQMLTEQEFVASIKAVSQLGMR